MSEDGDRDGEETAADRFSSEDVRRALMFIGPRFRVPYALFTFDRLSYAEIGERLSLTPGTVASRVFRTRQRLREILTSGEFRLRTIGIGQAESLAAVVTGGPAPARHQRTLRARGLGAPTSPLRPALEATG